nr:MAG TPA: hypothetical protein [Caudoviricetes sp.]
MWRNSLLTSLSLICLQRVPHQARFFICNHFLLFQLAHIHIAAPEISSMTAIIVFPPVALDSP